MRIMYYAMRVRPDILCTVNFLSSRTRLGTATQEDEKKLITLVQYIKATSADGITLGGDASSKLRIYAYADAAYGVHMDEKSHTGLGTLLVEVLSMSNPVSRNVSQNPAAKRKSSRYLILSQLSLG